MHSGAEEHGMWVLFSSLRQHTLFAFALHNIHSRLGYFQMIGLAGIKGKPTSTMHFQISGGSVNRRIHLWSDVGF